jgi:hypothetical protein
VLPDCENLPPIGRKQKLNGRSFSPIMSGDPSQGACHAGFPFWGTCVRQFFIRGCNKRFYSSVRIEGHTALEPDPET